MTVHSKARNRRIQVQCCVCKRFRHPLGWCDAQHSRHAGGPISYTYCPPCYDEVEREVLGGA